MSVIVNASNLHTGGGVQVAISFIYEISILDTDFSNFTILVSAEVHRGLIYLNINTDVFGNYQVVNTNGLKALFSPLNKIVKNCDVIFTIFGPNYLRVKAKKEITGFAQAWILNFNNPTLKKISNFNCLFLLVKFYLQWLFFLKTNHFVVELEHVKKDLVEKKGINKLNISVVHNTVSSLYLDPAKWKPIYLNKGSEKISIGIVSRDYLHKNLNILPAVADILNNKYKLHVHFYTTLDDKEWATKNDFFKNYVSTVGLLSPEECPSFYEQLDAVIFPSLLECFSATPLEAMVMKKPLFASDRGFVRDVCKNFSIYFDPEDAEDIAKKIFNYFSLSTDHSLSLIKASNYAIQFSSAKRRAHQYLEIIEQYLKG